jgi:hypothetical protein
MTDERNKILDELRVPAWCPVCEVVLHNVDTYYDWGCCKLCYIEFVEHREERWKSGWRPTDEQVQSARFMKKMH